MDPKKFIIGVGVFAGLCIGVFLVATTVVGLDDTIQGAEAPPSVMLELSRNIQETRLQAKEAATSEKAIPLLEAN
jgi:hypothetical protein